MIERGVTRQITVTRGNFSVIASSIPFTASKAKFTFRAYPRRESGRRKYIARAQWRNNSPGGTSYVKHLRDSIHLPIHADLYVVMNFFDASLLPLSL